MAFCDLTNNTLNVALLWIRGLVQPLSFRIVVGAMAQATIAELARNVTLYPIAFDVVVMLIEMVALVLDKLMHVHA